LVKNSPSVEVISFTHNESMYLEYLVKWYSAKFSNLTITIFDNFSTDNTVAKAKALGCNVKSWGNKDHMSESEFAEMKNSCFQGGESDYFLICDIDELLDLDDNDLLVNQPTIVQGIGYNMVGDSDTKFEEICRGSRDSMYDKCVLFRRSHVVAINYGEGAHWCKPEFISGEIRPDYLRKNLYHYRYLSLDFILERYQKRRQRVLEEEFAMGFAVQYFRSPDEIEHEYRQAMNTSVELSINWMSQNELIESDFPDWFQHVKHNFSQLPKSTNLLVLQIGVYKGDCTRYLLENHQISEIVDVDTWEGSMEHPAMNLEFKSVEEIYDKKFSKDKRVSKMKMSSDFYFANSLTAASFDFIYIDGSHTSTQVLKDGINGFARLKVGGILAFDDYEWPMYEGTLNHPKIGINLWLQLFNGYYELLAKNTQVWIRKMKELE
jgi:Methyltransferase domain/Glycosyl transferase family 2